MGEHGRACILSARFGTAPSTLSTLGRKARESSSVNQNHTQLGSDKHSDQISDFYKGSQNKNEDSEAGWQSGGRGRK